MKTLQQMSVALSNVEQRLILSLKDGSNLKDIAKDFEVALHWIQEQTAQDAFNTEQIHFLDKQAARVKQLAKSLASLDKTCSIHLRDAAKRAEHMFLETRKESKLLDEKPSTSDYPAVDNDDCVQINSIQETLYSNVFREWFLDNLADPFPCRQTKEELVFETNNLVKIAPLNEKTGKLSYQPVDLSQCSLWFINTRRRSNWTSFFRNFAHSDKNLMARLVDCLKREQDGIDAPETMGELEDLLKDEKIDTISCPITLAARLKKCREAFTTVTDWLRHISREKVADWMDNIVQEAKVELQVEKATMREQRKRLLDLEDKAEEERDHRKRKLVPARKKNVAKVATGQSNSIQKRKSNERKERVQYRKLPKVIVHTPDTSLGHIQFSDFSAGTASRSSSGSSYQAPSLFNMSDYIYPPSSCASSASSLAASLASYDAFHRPPGSPTLNIRKNSQPRELKQNELIPALMDAQMPITNVSSLYTSNLVPQLPLNSEPIPCIQGLQFLPSELDMETELSGGTYSQLTNIQPQAIDASSLIDQYSTFQGW